MRASRKPTVALACPEDAWPHLDWPAPDDPYVERAVHLAAPFAAGQEADVVILRCEDPLPALRKPWAHFGFT